MRADGFSTEESRRLVSAERAWFKLTYDQLGIALTELQEAERDNSIRADVDMYDADQRLEPLKRVRYDKAWVEHAKWLKDYRPRGVVFGLWVLGALAAYFIEGPVLVTMLLSFWAGSAARHLTGNTEGRHESFYEGYSSGFADGNELGGRRGYFVGSRVAGEVTEPA